MLKKKVELFCLLFEKAVNLLRLQEKGFYLPMNE